MVINFYLDQFYIKGEKVGDFIENQHIQIDYKQWAMCPPAST